MQPVTKSSRNQKLNEIRRLERMIQERRNQLRKEKSNFHKSQRIKKQKQLINNNDIEFEDLIQDQQNLMQQTSRVMGQTQSYFNQIVYDLRVQNEMSFFKNIQSQTSDIQDHTKMDRNKNEQKQQRDNNVPQEQNKMQVEQQKPSQMDQQIIVQKQDNQQMNVQSQNQQQRIDNQQQAQQQFQIDDVLSLEKKEQQSHPQHQSENNIPPLPLRQDEVDMNRESQIEPLQNNLNVQQEGQNVGNQIVEQPKKQQQKRQDPFENSPQQSFKIRYLDPEDYIARYSPFGQQLRYQSISKKKAIQLKIYRQGFPGYKLEHSKIPLIMQNFVKYDWSKLHILFINNCQLETSDWQLFCKNSHLFQGLRILSLTSNPIRLVRKQDLQKFPNLKALNFCNKSTQTNKLSLRSTLQLAQYQQQNKGRIKIFFKPQKK